jgi:RNA polymerase sigma-70 factor (ECF subfamily)
LPAVLQFPAPSSDVRIVARIRQGDRAAEELLYRNHALSLLNTTARLLRSRDQAEDVVQDTFVIALQGIGGLREPDKVKSWLMCIAVSLVRKRLRRNRLMSLLGFVDNRGVVPLDTWVLEGTSVEASAEVAVLDRIVSKLPVEQRLAWTLRHIEGEALDDVARALGKSLATVKRYVAAAERRIQDHVALAPESP